MALNGVLRIYLLYRLLFRYCVCFVRAFEYCLSGLFAGVEPVARVAPLISNTINHCVYVGVIAECNVWVPAEAIRVKLSP